MQHLYIGPYLKKDKVRDALHRARIKGNLERVSESEIDSFVEGFNEVMVERHRKFGDKITHSEMQEIIKIMARDHTDIVNNQELETISDILLDKDFIF